MNADQVARLRELMEKAKANPCPDHRDTADQCDMDHFEVALVNAAPDLLDAAERDALCDGRIHCICHVNAALGIDAEKEEG